MDSPSLSTLTTFWSLCGCLCCRGFNVSHTPKSLLYLFQVISNDDSQIRGLTFLEEVLHDSR